MADKPIHWMIVSSLDNFHISQDLKFSMQGIKSRHRKKAEKMRPGDTMMLYCTKIMQWGAIIEIKSEYFEDETIVWGRGPKRTGETYPFRVKTKPLHILAEDNFIDTADFKYKLSYFKKWPEKHWRLAFQGNVHILPDQDHAILVKEFEARGATSKMPREAKKKAA